MNALARLVVCGGVIFLLLDQPAAGQAPPKPAGYVEKIRGEVWLESGDNKIKLDPRNRNHRSRKLYVNDTIRCVNGGVLEIYLYKDEEDNEPRDRRVVIKEEEVKITAIGGNGGPKDGKMDSEGDYKVYRVPGRSGSGN
jgi:hypothetical protein